MAMKGVSSKTHSQKQLDDYANQHNPNNKAYQARMANAKMSKKALKHKANENAKRRAILEEEWGVAQPLEWFCYSDPYD